MSIRFKIMLSMLVVAMLFLPINFYLLKEYLQVRNSFLNIVDKTVPRLEALMSMQELTVQITVFISAFNREFQEIPGNPNTPDKVAAAKDRFLSLLEELGEQQSIYKKHMAQENSEKLSQLRGEVTMIALEVFSAKEKKLPEENIRAKINLLEQKEEQLNELIKSLLLQESSLLEEEREKTFQDANNLRNSLLFLNVLVIVIALLLSLFLMRVISKPLMRLSHFARNIDYENLQPLLPILSKDEIGQLQTHLNLMVAKLNKTKTNLIETSRAAGIAEITTGILHNVGNVLNSMKTNIAILRENTKFTPGEPLKKIMKILEENRDNLVEYLQHDEKGQLLLPYFKMLIEQIEKEYLTIQQELQILSRDLLLVNQIVTVQQNSASKGVNIQEDIEIDELIEDILVLYAGRLRKEEINVERRYGKIPVFLSVKNKLQQILINLIKNAIDALSKKQDEKRLIISTKLDKTKKIIFIKIRDNGIGIKKQNMGKIFSFGFTTKQEGYGFGLHNSALLAEKLDGKIRCNSKGINQGTAFTLEIPLRE